MLKKRYLEPFIARDLEEKMVFIGGPRQVGKTTLAKAVGESAFSPFSYYNWDDRKDRQTIMAESFDRRSVLLIFDELHKMGQWKRFIKGVYDTRGDRFRIVVTGSARLDVYRRGGDSLQGRYHYLRLHPFSLREALSHAPTISLSEEPSFLPSTEEGRHAYEALMKFGGFPEPFLRQDEHAWRRWRNERTECVIKEDIRDIELVRDLSKIQLLADALPAKVGAPFSLNALREDLEVTHPTVSSWVNIFERFYYLFLVYPFASTAIKSMRKQPKMYLWDWSEIENEGARLENMVASHLLKFSHFLHDVEGFRVTLHYVRDREGREVDFLVTIDKKPWFAVEVKQSRGKSSNTLRLFGEKLRIPFLYQIVGEYGVDYLHERMRVMSVDKFLTGLV